VCGSPAHVGVCALFPVSGPRPATASRWTSRSCPQSCLLCLGHVPCALLGPLECNGSHFSLLCGGLGHQAFYLPETEFLPLGAHASSKSPTPTPRASHYTLGVQAYFYSTVCKSGRSAEKTLTGSCSWLKE